MEHPELSGQAEWRRLGAHIAALRRMAEQSQADLGKAVGLSAEYIANVELGHHRPKLRRLRKLAAALHGDCSEFARLAGYLTAAATDVEAGAVERSNLITWFAGLPLEQMRAIRQRVDAAWNGDTPAAGRPNESAGADSRRA